MNQKDPIEELFRENQHGLDEKPPEMVWDRIEEKLDQKSNPASPFQWWKYLSAACILAGLVVVGINVFDKKQTDISSENSAPIVFENPDDFNQATATQLLDSLEGNQQSIATTLDKAAAPDQLEKKSMVIRPSMQDEPVHINPENEISAPVYVESKSENQTPRNSSQAKEMKQASGEIMSEKQEDENFVSAKKTNPQRMGNAADVSISYEASPMKDVQTIQIPINETSIVYDLTSKESNRLYFTNSEVDYPSTIIFQKSKDSVDILYIGKESRKKKKISQEIQHYIQAHKEEIIQNLQFNP